MQKLVKCPACGQVPGLEPGQCRCGWCINNFVDYFPEDFRNQMKIPVNRRYGIYREC